jgi:ubiquinol-cytochrome c reductase cytochrome b subunit
MLRLLDWLDHRTGYRALARMVLYEHIPGGARWRYVWGSTLSFAFLVQVITGICLWTAYSPSSQTAWESVYFIQHQMTAGWLLRGVHHYTSHIMIVLLGIHLLQVVIDGAYRAPREVNFWIGLVLMQIVLALSLTGYLLPWDQKGFWATKVATNIVALVPLVGGSLEHLIVGGTDYGHHTLTRFFALHAGVLPGLLVLFLVMHLALFRRHGLKAKEPHRAPDCTFWPDQVLRDGVACLAVMICVIALVLWNLPAARTSDMPTAHLGAELGPPADPSEPFAAARPDWQFLFLFQLLKYTEGLPPAIGAILLPGLLLASLVFMPLVGRWELGHRFNILWTFVLLAGIGALTCIALYEDYSGTTEKSQHYLKTITTSKTEAHRVVEMAGAAGIPKGGALELLQNDPKTEGPKLFARYCAACHAFSKEGREGISLALIPERPQVDWPEIHVENPTASNLYGFASWSWLAGILNGKTIAGPHYFGNTALVDGEMVPWVQEMIDLELSEADDAKKEEIRTNLANAILALSAEAHLPYQTSVEDREKIAKQIEAGQLAIVESFACVDCHKFRDDGDLGAAPDLTGYGSRDWLLALVANPEHERFYPDTNDRMPAFAANADDPSANRLSPKELGLLVDWLRGDWLEPDSNTPPLKGGARGESR